jgi:hypothetical protein
MGKCVDETKGAVWGRRLARFALSGQTVTAFCGVERVSVQTFYRWKRKLVSESVGRQRERAGDSLSVERTRAFLPVRIEGAAMVEIGLPNGTHVRVPASDLGAIEAAIVAAGRVPSRVAAETPRC